MHRVDTAGVAAALPAFTPVGATAGYFEDLENGDPASTLVDRDWLNAIQEEIISVLTAAGITTAKGTNTQLRDAIRALANGLVYVPDVGGANAYVINPNPASGAYVSGQRYLVKFAHANTGASTLNVSGQGAVPLTRGAEVALQAGDIQAGMDGLVVYDGADWQLISEVQGIATTLVAGLVALATAAQVAAGVDATHAITPAALVGAAAPCTLTPAANINWDVQTLGANSGPNASLVLGQNTTLNLVNYQAGLPYTLEVFQPAGHAYTLNLPQVNWGASGAPEGAGSPFTIPANGSILISIYCASTSGPRLRASWN